MKQNKLSQAFAKFKETLKPMTWRQRLDHLWTYYKEYFLVGVLATLVLVLIVSSIINAQVEVLFSGVLANIDMTDDGYAYLSDGYYDKLGGGKWQEVRTSAVYFEFLSADINKLDYNYYTAVGTIGMVDQRTLDYIMCNENALEFYIQQDIFMDLSEVFTKEELADMEEYLIYGQVEGETERYPAALNMEYMAFARENILMEEPMYLTFIANTQRPELCRDFWDYLMAWEPAPEETQSST